MALMLVQSEIVSIFNNALGQKGRLRKGGSQITYHCPFCFDKNLITQKLEIAINGAHIGSYHCWRCNTKGRTFGTLLKRVNAPQQYRDALFKLTGDIRLSRNYASKQDESEVVLPEEFRPLSQKQTTPEYKNALAYVKKRGLLPEDILRYNIGYCEEGTYEHHIIIPSYDAEGKLNFFIGRRYYASEGYLNYKKPDVPMDVVGFESFVNYDEPLSLCEGVFDAIAIRNNAVPLFGKYPSKKLLESMILNGTTRVNIVLDNDARNDAVKDYHILKNAVPNVDIHIVWLDGKDPSVLGFERIHRLIQDAKQFDFDDLMKFELGL